MGDKAEIMEICPVTGLGEFYAIIDSGDWVCLAYDPRSDMYPSVNARLSIPMRLSKEAEDLLVLLGVPSMPEAVGYYLATPSGENGPITPVWKARGELINSTWSYDGPYKTRLLAEGKGE